MLHPANRRSLLAFLLVAVVWLLQLLAIHAWSLSNGKGGLAPVELGNDDGRFYYGVARQWAFGTPYEDNYHRTGSELRNAYPMTLAVLMSLTGSDSVLLLKFVNYLACLVALWCACHLAGSLSGSVDDPPQVPAACHPGLVLALGCYPSLSFFGFSFSLCRDGIIYALFLACCCFISKLYGPRGKNSPGTLLACFVFLGLLFAFRWYMAILVLGACLAVITLDLARRRLSGTPSELGFSGVFAALCVVAFCGMSFRLVSERMDSFRNILAVRDGYRGSTPARVSLSQSADSPVLPLAAKAFSAKRPASSQPDGNLDIHYTDQPPAVWPLLYSYSLASNAYGPFPWQVKNIRMAAAVPEGLVLLAVTLYLLAHWRHIDRPLGLLLAQAVCWLMVIGLFNDNLGTSLRLRVPASMLLIVCAAVIYARIRAAGVRPAFMRLLGHRLHRRAPSRAVQGASNSV